MVNRFILNETSYHGKGAIKSIPDEIIKRGFKKALVCSDSILNEIGVTKKVTNLLVDAEIEFELFTDIKANPTVTNVKNGVEKFKSSNADCIIAVGGGSTIDASKGIGIIATNPEFGDVVSLEGVADTKNKSIPIIAVPTTAGTAAEVTINYVITDEEASKKLVCVDPNDIPIVAVVDPDMISSMSASLTAATGMDALTHAIEGYITKGAWELSDMFHINAIKLIADSLRDAVNNSSMAFEKMALGQYMAGMGFSNVGLGIVHSMAHPLGALYDTPHGVANAIILPTVMEYNALESGNKYKEIARAMGVDEVDSMSIEEYRNAAIETVKKLSFDIGIPSNLKGILRADDLDFLSSSAYNDPCTPGNPKDTNIEDIKQLYKKLL